MRYKNNFYNKKILKKIKIEKIEINELKFEFYY